jgi:uncharacterized membrane protein
MESVRAIQNTGYSLNVSEAERWFSAIAGGALLACGLKAQGTTSRVVTGVAGCGLASPRYHGTLPALLGTRYQSN